MQSHPSSRSQYKNTTFSRSLNHALRGLWHALRAESNVRRHFYILFITFVITCLLKAQPFWYALILFTGLNAVGAEIFNTAIESLADRVDLEENDFVRIAKDCGAAGVLVFASAHALCFVIFLATHLQGLR